MSQLMTQQPSITEESERKKYTKMWTEVPGYRVRSPGEVLVPEFLTSVDWKPGDSLIDIGCGPGLASLKLAEVGFNVTMTDLCAEAPVAEARLKLPFVVANLWNITWTAKFDWIYCCDVLEHIPPEHVDTVLNNMARLTVKGGFLQIAMFEDNREGETLHLCIQQPRWWELKLFHRWELKRFEIVQERIIAVLGKPL